MKNIIHSYILPFMNRWEKNVPIAKEIHMQSNTPQNGVSEGFSF